MRVYCSYSELTTLKLSKTSAHAFFFENLHSEHLMQCLQTSRIALWANDTIRLILLLFNIQGHLKLKEMSNITYKQRLHICMTKNVYLLYVRECFNDHAFSMHSYP